MENTTIAFVMRVLDVAFDVSSDRLDGGYRLQNELQTLVCANESSSIRATLGSIQEQAASAGYEEIRVLCESTGVCHRCLLDVAGSLGMRTNLVSGEAVCAQRKVRFNDVGKKIAGMRKSYLMSAALVVCCVIGDYSQLTINYENCIGLFAEKN